MSAFVCDDKTINRIVAGLEFCKNHGDYGKALPKLNKELAEVFDTPREFGRTLYAMNVNAVEQRYPDCVGNANNLPGQCDEEGNHTPFTYCPTMPGTAIQLYKSLECFLYQCSEGDVDELPLYKALEKFTDKLAHHMTRGSQAYDKAEWG
jgi:hypothetical protein